MLCRKYYKTHMLSYQSSCKFCFDSNSGSVGSMLQLTSEYLYLAGTILLFGCSYISSLEEILYIIFFSLIQESTYICLLQNFIEIQYALNSLVLVICSDFPHQIEFYGDFDGWLHKSLELYFDLSTSLLGHRSQWYYINSRTMFNFSYPHQYSIEQFRPLF